jgi:serine/threonine protein kinase
MTTSSSERAAPVPLTPEAAAALAARLVWEMIQRWRQGERPLPEDFLARYPDLWQHPEAAADLIYEELCLRQEHGPEIPVEQVLRRFPHWRPQLEVLLDCQRVLGPSRPPPQFPAAGEGLGDFLLLAEIGSGAQGRVFLASQLSLGDRPVVLKVTPAEAREHLALARLQHTHIVPLYSVHDHPDRRLRALCMPYFGGATLDRLLHALRSRPLVERTGQDLLDALDRVQAGAPLAAPFRGRARQALAAASYVEAVCWAGACLADALQDAHDRGLVHLDLKPSNVLLAADGQPMLLDFHLAREPVHPDGAWPEWLGGTPAYMSPEQQAAVDAVQRGRPVPRPVDGRSDIYSLGVVLYEALDGGLPEPGAPPRTLHRRHPQVSVGLADIVGKCLAHDPARRYADMAALAADLRRHLAHRPLVGVRNRSLAERWQKWRRRRPHGAARAAMLLAVLMASVGVAIGAATHYRQRVEQARTALSDGQVQRARGEWEGAVCTLQRGLAVARGTPGQWELTEALEHGLRRAEQGRADADRAAAGRTLHELADRVRFLYGADRASAGQRCGLAASCRAFWEQRGRIVRRLSNNGGAALDPACRDDLLDVAIFWADLQVCLAPSTGTEEAGRQALTVLAEAEGLLGPSPVLDEERRLHGAPPRPACPGVWCGQARTAWEHYALGRALLRAHDLARAEQEVAASVRLQPHGLWPNFYQGLCAYLQGRYTDATLAYSVCVGVAPDAAGCWYNRSLALAALGRTDQALSDYDEAVRLDPTLAAVLDRRIPHDRAGHPNAGPAWPAAR